MNSSSITNWNVVPVLIFLITEIHILLLLVMQTLMLSGSFRVYIEVKPSILGLELAENNYRIPLMIFILSFHFLSIHQY